MVKLLVTGDRYKDEVQRQWNNDHCGEHYVDNADHGSLEWFQNVELYRYGTYAPWMPEVMEFAKHPDRDVLEIGAGLGTDLAQFATFGARTTDLDLSGGHLAMAKKNFKLRGLSGNFVHGDGEGLPFDDNSFDVVYSNGVIHHTPNTAQVVDEILRVLRPGGRAIIMVYAEWSLHYWRNLVNQIGVREESFDSMSIGEIMSCHVEISSEGQRPLVKVYSAEKLRKMFEAFSNIQIYKRQMVREEIPRALSWLSLDLLQRLMGWNLIIKCQKPDVV